MLSDRHSNAELAPIPSLLLTSAIHHHLVREKTRTQVGLVVEAGDVREVHHVALLIGYGAAAVNPYLAIETRRGPGPRAGSTSTIEPEKAVQNVIKALGKGVLKVMSKMGISTVGVLHRRPDLRGARPVPASCVDEYFTGTTSKLGGIGLAEIAEEVRRRHLRRLPGRRHPAGAPRCCRSAGSTSGAARASRTCSTRRRCSGCSTRPGRAATTSSSSTPATSTTRPSG